MSVQHRVPLSPEELPQQRLAPVANLPQLPAGLAIHVVFLRDTGSARLPEEPGSENWYQASLEWAWSPMNNRQDHYYLSRDAGRWFLWNCYQESLDELDFDADQGFLKLTPTWYLLSWCERGELSARDAGIHLLRAFLHDECQDGSTGLDRFHFIADTGALSVGDLHAIAREVWPGNGHSQNNQEQVR